MTPIWADFFKIFTYQFTPDPYSRRANTRDLTGAGVTQPDAIPMMGPDGNMSGGGGDRQVRFRDTNEMIDLSSVSNRQSRYKEYQRLLGVPEIDRALTVFADEACLAGWTKVQTPHGEFTLEQLAKTRANDRFLVYCRDEASGDYTLGWAFAPRKTKTAKTITLVFDNGKLLTLTPDHRVMKRDGKFIQAGEAKIGDLMMPFYRLKPDAEVNKLHTGQQPRIHTHTKGWVNERQFVDDWKLGKTQQKYEEANKIARLVSGGLVMEQILTQIPHDWKTIKLKLARTGFTYKELKKLGQKEDARRIVDVRPGPEIDVYDMSVEKHQNFCTDSIVVHNCQKDTFGNVFKIECGNMEVNDELKHFFFHRKQLNMNRRSWAEFRKMCLLGDLFWEAIINPERPSDGISNFASLPADSIFRIETTKGKIIEFQQAREGPDYNALVRAPIMQATDAEIAQSTAIRFAPEQIVHIRIGDDRKTFYPYGISLVESARGPAHQLRLMEDAMLVYRLCLTGNTRVRTNTGFRYIKDVQAGDKVFSINMKTLVADMSTVTWAASNGKKQVYEVRTRHTSLQGTHDHPVLARTKDGVRYVPLAALQIGKDQLINVANLGGEEIPIPRVVEEAWAKLSETQRSVFRSRDYKNRSELMRTCPHPTRAKQFLYAKSKCLPLDKAKFICNVFGLDASELIVINKGEVRPERVRLPLVVTEAFARLFGFLMGDGFANNNSFGICAGDDKNVNKEYSKLLNIFFTEATFTQDKRRSAGQGKYVVSNTAALKIMKEMGYGENHDFCRVPAWVFQAKPNIRRAFVEGLSDADGCERFTKRGTWFSTIAVHNQGLVDDIKEIWSSIGLNSGKITHRRRKGHRIDDRMIKDTECWCVTLTDLPLEMYENVISVQKMGEEEVYDIGVDSDHHNFVANGVPVHNSRAPERRIFYIDVGQLPPFKAEAFVERLKDQFRKKKVATNRSPYQGANQVEERWHAPAVDEDYWLPMRKDSQTKIDTLPGACLALDTKIPLLDGRTLALSEIISEVEAGKKLWTYSIDPKTGSNAPGRISWAGITRRNTEVVRVTFDNGESIVCTPDHNFPVQGKGKVEAKDLKPGYSMFPFETRMENLSTGWKSKYEQAYDSFARDWVFTHRMVANAVKGTEFGEEMIYSEQWKDEKKTVIHHKNIDRRNNSPENLAWMGWKDHEKWHRDHQEQTNANISKALTNFINGLSEEEKESRHARLRPLSRKASQALQEKITDPEMNRKFRESQTLGWKRSKLEKPNMHIARGKNTSERNTEMWKDEVRKKAAFDKQRVKLPDVVWEAIRERLVRGEKVSEILSKTNADAMLMSAFANANSMLVRKSIDTSKGVSKENLEKEIVLRGFKTMSQLRMGIATPQETTSSEIIWPDALWNFFLQQIKNGHSSEQALETVNASPLLLKEFAEANAGNYGKGFRFKGKLTMFYIKQMVRSKGYKDTRHLKKEANNYNHKVVSVEILPEKIDVGTITIDGNELLNDFHTFAVSGCGIYTYNSNLGEIDDAVYFRNKLFVALNFPPNYLSNDDPNATRITLSAQDVKFAHIIERLQANFEDGLWELADRHLQMLGYPPDVYDDLVIKMTPPSDWAELSRAETTNNRVTTASSLKSAQLMSDYDVHIRYLRHTEEETQEMIARLKIQKLEELKLQVLAQNPQLLGVGVPGQAGEDGQEIGSQAGGPNPMLGGDPAAGGTPPPPGGGLAAEEPPEAGGPGASTPDAQQPQGIPLSDPEEEDITRYDLEIQDYDAEQDISDIDYSELEN